MIHICQLFHIFCHQWRDKEQYFLCSN